MTDLLNVCMPVCVDSVRHLSICLSLGVYVRKRGAHAFLDAVFVLNVRMHLYICKGMCQYLYYMHMQHMYGVRYVYVCMSVIESVCRCISTSMCTCMCIV